MVLITSGSYVTAELQLEFGKIPPAFLPLGGKRLYEHQIKLFKDLDEEVVLSLPESFQVSNIELEHLEALNIKPIFVPDGITLGESIVYAANMSFPIFDGLHILHGDTYFEHLKFGQNILGLSYVESNYNWTYILEEGKQAIQTTNSLSKEFNNPEQLIVNGYFNFEDPYLLIQSIVKSNYSFIDGLKYYSKNKPLSIHINSSWLDFGLVSNYFHSKKKMTTERAFNSLKVKKGYIEKSSSMPQKLCGEINWFESLPNTLLLNVPRFQKNGEDVYKLEYLFHNTLSELFVYGRLPFYIWQQIFRLLKSFLTNLHEHKGTNKSSNFSYMYKTKQRLQEYIKEDSLDLEKAWKFNGKQMPSINAMLQELEQYIQPSSNNYFIHGDFHFANIMMDFRSDSIKTFDPKGVDFEGNITVYGDKRYDYAKLMHSVFGLYDFIIAKQYHCRVNDYMIEFEIQVSQTIQKIQKLFLEIFEIENINEMYALTIHLFLSMLPLHNDDNKKQHAILANAFRLYGLMKESK